ncbi:MAG TPA: hypothetical protein VLD61_08895 [Methylomirabilota bacterium]|nr:hypothetical protein [Methylomirabilota bacterium]
MAGLTLIALTACAAPGPPLDPASLTLHGRDQIFRFDYRIDREPGRVEAVGLLNSSAPMFRFVRLRLVGVTADGRVASQGFTTVDGTFGVPVRFSVNLRPTGAEASFELLVDGYALGFGGR